MSAPRRPTARRWTSSQRSACGAEPVGVGVPDLQDLRGCTAVPRRCDTIRSLGLEVVLPRKSGGGTDGNCFNAKGIPCLGLPTGMVDEHATSEHIAIDDMITACKLLTEIVTQNGHPIR